jgi:hypothetical protein
MLPKLLQTKKRKLINKKKEERANRNVYDGHTFSRKKRNKTYKIKSYEGKEQSSLVYHNGLLIRNMANEKYEIWKTLFDKGYNVEPIIEAKKYKRTLLSRIFAKLGEFDSPDITVTSKPIGYALFGTLRTGHKVSIRGLENSKKIHLEDCQKSPLQHGCKQVLCTFFCQSLKCREELLLQA